MNRPIPQSKWRWYGCAGHLCVAPWCRYHLSTEVGKYFISTVGEYYPPHATERDCPSEPAEIGCARLYETYVFRIGKGRCKVASCLCGLPNFVDHLEIYGVGANLARDAAKHHMEACQMAANGGNFK